MRGKHLVRVGLSQRTLLLEQVAAPLRRLDRVRQRHLGDLAREGALTFVSFLAVAPHIIPSMIEQRPQRARLTMRRAWMIRSRTARSYPSSSA